MRITKREQSKCWPGKLSSGITHLKENGIQSQLSFSMASPPYFRLFRLSVGNSQNKVCISLGVLRFTWKHTARRQGRITEQVMLVGTTGDYLVQPPHSSRVSQSILLRSVSKMRKDLRKYLKNTVPSHNQGMAPPFLMAPVISNDCLSWGDKTKTLALAHHNVHTYNIKKYVLIIQC